MFKWVTIGLVIVGLVGMAYFISTQKNRPSPGQAVQPAGRNHIADNTAAGNYNSNPPTSGDHWQVPADWGIYSEELADEKVVHNLEHGGVWISYNCSVPESNRSPQDFATDSAIPATSTVSAKLDDDSCKKLIADLESIARQYRSKVILTPRSKNDSRIALASWGRLWKFDRFDQARVAEFVSANRNNGPEFVPD